MPNKKTWKIEDSQCLQWKCIHKQLLSRFFYPLSVWFYLPVVLSLCLSSSQEYTYICVTVHWFYNRRSTDVRKCRQCIGTGCNKKSRPMPISQRFRKSCPQIWRPGKFFVCQAEKDIDTVKRNHVQHILPDLEASCIWLSADRFVHSKSEMLNSVIIFFRIPQSCANQLRSPVPHFRYLFHFLSSSVSCFFDFFLVNSIRSNQTISGPHQIRRFVACDIISHFARDYSTGSSASIQTVIWLPRL